MWRWMFLFIGLILFVGPIAPGASAADLPQTLWLEAETFSPLHGGNFSYQHPEKTTKGSWAVAGPGVAAAWTQGGESEWMSIGARADEPGEVVCGREAQVPAAGRYTLWVRYADYRQKKELFGVRIKQGTKIFSHVFGEYPVVDELDPMKLLWDWAFGWDHAEVDLTKGPVRVELYTTGPTEARRNVDCLCLTTDATYHPAGREKPDCAAWLPLRAAARAGIPDVQPLVKAKSYLTPPPAWTISTGPPGFFWNVADSWLDELKRPANDRVEWPYGIDPPIEQEFLKNFRGKDIPVFGDALSGPTPHIPNYPVMLAPKSLFSDWLARHRDRKFAILLNYGDPNWHANDDKAGIYENLRKFGDRFIGFVAGENLSYDSPDGTKLDQGIKTATTRGQVLAALREAHDAATAKKYSGYFGVPVSPAQAWSTDIPCLSAGMEAYAHAVADWGVKRIGHENTGNSPTLARRLAFLRGAARQFGVHVCDYQSCNLGDSSTIFSRKNSFFPASSQYILDNNYDIWAGAGLNWALKDYLLFWIAGADSFYHEEGNDILWKPGGNSAGDEFPIALSPRGRLTQAFMKLAASHRIGVQVTPIAFLMDEAHGWSQEVFNPGAFGLDRESNPKLLSPGPHEASIRGWFDIAYYPAPETQNEPASAIRQTYVNGIFGDIFDVVVTAPKHADIIKTYPVLVASGQVPISSEWGHALHDYVRAGGTLVVCLDQLSGPGVAELGIPAPGDQAEASSFRWKLTNEAFSSNVFHYTPLTANGASVLAETLDGKPIVTLTRQGDGQLITIGIPLGLGIDERPTPILSMLMRHLSQGLLPVKVTGDVEWALNRLDDGGWLVTLLNNRGVIKPEHGVLPTDYREAQDVTLTTSFKIAQCREWVASQPLHAAGEGGGGIIRLAVPAGAVRQIRVAP